MSMSETELIRRLTRDLPADSSVLTGPGDDCAVLDWGGSKLLFKTDAIVEGIHFERNTSPEAIGRKALARPIRHSRHGRHADPRSGYARGSCGHEARFDRSRLPWPS